MNILITGGTGLIGKRLCTALLQQGHNLTVLSRNPDSVKTKCGSEVKAIASLNDYQPDTVYHAIINLAGEPIVDKRWTNTQKQRLINSRVTLTEQLIQRITDAKHKPQVLISGSAVGFYGNGGDTILQEDAPPAQDFGATLCNHWEQTANKATELGIRVCLLRTGLVLDPTGGLLKKMQLPFKLGLGATLASGTQWMSWIHHQDYIQIILILLENKNASGAYNMTAPEPVTNKQFTKTLAKHLHRPALLNSPAWLLKLILGEQAQLLIGGQRALPTKIQTLGYNFHYTTLEQALNHIYP